MRINRKNYESYFIDFLEGELEEDMINEFIEFLSESPDLKDELEGLESCRVEAENLIFKNKARLYKEKYDLEPEFNRTAVAFLEGDLPEREMESFEAYLSTRPGKQKEFALFEKAKLRPDETLVFRKKNRLYHAPHRRVVLLWTARVAAVLLLAFLVYRFSDNQSRMNLLSENAVVLNETKVRQEVPETARVSEKAEKEEVPASPAESKPDKREEPVSPSGKSLRESPKASGDYEKVAAVLMRAEVPERIGRRSVSLKGEESLDVSLEPMGTILLVLPDQPSEERLFADVVREKSGLGNLSLGKIAKAGLNLVSGISNERFNYKTNPEGEITGLSFDSRLLAFTIPTKNN